LVISYYILDTIFFIRFAQKVVANIQKVVYIFF